MLISAVLGCAGCGAGDRDGTGAFSAPVIFGDDDRKEYYESASPELQGRAAGAMVAIVSRAHIDAAATLTPQVRSWGDMAQLCPDEPFREQPAAAFCSGVLVDWDLVLTAAHCVRAFPLADLRFVFGYYYQAPSELALTPEGVLEAAEIVAERLDARGTEPRLDYAWVRLKHAASSASAPAPLWLGSVTAGARLTSVGTPGGLPLKLDSGGTIQDAREATRDYFLANTDTLAGSSGGAAFDANAALLGVLARGGRDLIATLDNCNVSARQPSNATATEEFTYARAALEGLCAAGPDESSLCHCEGAELCGAASQPARVLMRAQGCAVARGGQRLPGTGLGWAFAAALAVLTFVRRSSAVAAAGARTPSFELLPQLCSCDFARRLAQGQESLPVPPAVFQVLKAPISPEDSCLD